MSTQITDPIEAARLPPAIPLYLNLDLTAAGTIARDLLAHVDDEASLERIHLSHIVGPIPANITPHMSSWYQTHIRPVRDAAFHAVNRVFIERADPARGVDFFLENKLGFLEENLLKEKLACYERQTDKNRTMAQTIATLEAGLARDEAQYDRRKAALGRAGKPLNRPLNYSRWKLAPH